MVTDSAASRSACYVKNPNSATGPDVTLAVPEGEHPHLYLLGMVGVVIGRPLFRVTAVQAVRGIAALTLVADLGTERLGSGLNGGGHTDARQFPGACIVGPALVTSDEFSPGADWALAVRVNGRPVGAGASALNLEQAATVVAGLSSRYAFRPGDIVGLPAGISEFELPPSSRVSLTLNATLELGFATGA
jgi:2-keto-4-pentenoate hydratase/2-oxohepta-3-ene-1,7-dioic acid hydratase in catechol pathway